MVLGDNNGIYDIQPFLEGLADTKIKNAVNGQAPIYEDGLYVNKHVATSDVAFTGTAGDTVIVNSTGDGITSTSVLHVDTVNSRIGINVANPTEDLEIDGNIQIDTSGLGRLIFYDGNDDHEHCELDGDDDGTTGGKFLVKTKVDGGSVTEKLSVNNVGNLQLNTGSIIVPTDATLGKDASNNAITATSASGTISIDLKGLSYGVIQLTDTDATVDISNFSFTGFNNNAQMLILYYNNSGGDKTFKPATSPISGVKMPNIDVTVTDTNYALITITNINSNPIATISDLV